MGNEPADLLRQSPDGATGVSRIDVLTGLPNRLEFEFFLSDRDDAELVGVIFADIDGFMAINDVHGHSIGDQVLIEFARRVATIKVPDSIAMRPGGDEYVVILAGFNHVASVQTVAESLLRICDTPFTFDEATIYLRLSVGIAIAPLSHAHTGLAAAEVAMYEAKTRGGARAVCLDPAWEVRQP